MELRERLQRTHLQQLILPPDATLEHPDMQELLQPYRANLIPDQTFYYMVQREFGQVQGEIDKGGMLNRDTPTPAEREKYPPNYETVAEQMLHDLTGKTDRPGSFRMTGLRDENGTLLTTLSFRLPPTQQSEETDRYVDYLRSIFKEVKLLGYDMGDLEPSFSTMMEIDTINGCKRLPGSGLKTLAETLKMIDDELGNNAPEWIYYYRFSQLRPADQQGRKPGLDYLAGENSRSGRLFSSCGFIDLGHADRPNEVVVREVPNLGIMFAHPVWKFGFANFQAARQLSEKSFEEFMGM